MKLYNLSVANLNRINPRDITIAIYGLGKMGLPLAVVFANKGFQVIGCDINKEVVEKINKGINPIIGEGKLDQLLKRAIKKKTLRATVDGILASKNSDIKIILVPIYLNNHNNPDLSLVRDVVRKIAKGINIGDIVILESTAPPGTTLSVIGEMIEEISGLTLNKDFGVANCPERVSSGTAVEDIKGRLCPKIIGGSDSKTAIAVKFIYSKINKLGVIEVQNPSYAELVKLWGEIYRDVNIAFANNLYLSCRELGVDAHEIIKIANTNPYCKILTPGPGVGGHCIPVYPYFLLKTTRENHALLKIARLINDSMSDHVVALVKNVLSEKNIHLAKANILILGIAYRAGVKETRKSPGIKIAKELLKKVANLYVYDPQFSKKEVEDFKLKYKNNYLDIDCIIITTDEDEFKRMNWRKIGNQLRSKVVVDTKDVTNFKILSQLGFSIRRIGYAN